MFKKLWEQLAITTNWPALVAALVLATLGILTISADHPEEGIKQLVFLGVGVGAMTAFQAVNYQMIGRFAWALYILSLLTIIYTVIPGVPGVNAVKGARAWIQFPGFSFQPAEMMKIAFILVLARYLRFRSNYRNFLGLLQPFLVAVVPMVVILKQPDLGTVLTFIPPLFAMLFVAGAKIRHLAVIVLLGLMLVPIAWMAGKDDKGVAHSSVPGFKYLPELIKPYQRERVEAMFDTNPRVLQRTGFQIDQAQTAMGSGGWRGKGVGEVPVGRHVPESHNDMVFALIGEQFGYFGSLVVLGAYLVLFMAGIEISAATKEPFGKLVALGITSQLAGQSFLNLMVVTGLMPVTGVTLPFISAGGSSLVASFMAVGLLLNVGQNRPIVLARDSFEFD